MELSKRKHPRLKEYDYSLSGYYYVTIHTADENTVLSSVGRGLAPAVSLTEIGKIAKEQLLELENRYSFVKIDKYVVMPTHIHAIIQFTEAAGLEPERCRWQIQRGRRVCRGRQVTQPLRQGNCRVPQTERPRPTLMDVICAYKSITTRLCNQRFGTPGMKRFQTSFYETVLRNENAYQECWRYIDENPLKWSLKPEDR